MTVSTFDSNNRVSKHTYSDASVFLPNLNKQLIIKRVQLTMQHSFYKTLKKFKTSHICIINNCRAEPHSQECVSASCPRLSMGVIHHTFIYTFITEILRCTICL